MDQRHAGQLGSLEKALRAHKAYWTTDQERADSCYGWVALAPLAMACLALDADFSIEIESDYMPGHLLKATWAGEFPTGPLGLPTLLAKQGDRLLHEDQRLALRSLVRGIGDLDVIGGPGCLSVPTPPNTPSR
ncbi:Imm49 family immunity protein [Streptomyces sp. NPDC091387]|uniref:Imm49 family immunity protein n=1 Tax=Streptomyces sp. NPDC091387 TaxID=3365998 RepID=UPI0038230A76